MTNINIIPEPVSLQIFPKKFTLTENIAIYSTQDLISLGEYLKKLINPATGFKFENFDFNNAPMNEKSINLILLDNSKNLGAEGYSLEITPSNIKISATCPNGVFYGIQTLRQLLPIEIEQKKIVQDINWELPCLKILDFPRFCWRGYMLDEARHFHGKKVVKGLIDLLALFKLNRFHWHLTDDQGWRIEIKKYPKLTKIGSKREETQVGGLFSKKRDGIPHS
ncbi:MAG: family 20 glycosylhydrolase, partial [Promethearchaeota archaeon]